METLIGLTCGFIGGGLIIWGWAEGSRLGKVLSVVWCVAVLGVIAVGYTAGI